MSKVDIAQTLVADADALGNDLSFSAPGEAGAVQAPQTPSKGSAPAAEPAPDPKGHAVPSQDDDHELADLLAEAERVIGPA